MSNILTFLNATFVNFAVHQNNVSLINDFPYKVFDNRYAKKTLDFDHSWTETVK